MKEDVSSVRVPLAEQAYEWCIRVGLCSKWKSVMLPRITYRFIGLV